MAKKITSNKIDIDKLSLEELKKLQATLYTAHEECGSTSCSCCKADCHNFIGRASKMGCDFIRDEIDDLVEKLEKEENQHPAPQNKELPEPPYDIDKLSFPQLFNLAEKVNDVQGKHQVGKCGGCISCVSDRHNFTGRVANEPCGNIQSEINILIAKYIVENWNVLKKDLEAKKSIEKKEKPKSQNCSCLNCKWIDSATLHNGYCFCLHWHNFTIEDGNCHAYESREEPVETCG